MGGVIMFRYGRLLPALTLMAALAFHQTPEVRAQTAKDLDCRKCVDKRDIARRAVNASRLRDGAVSTRKIRDGAVTRDKLAPGALGPDLIFRRTRFVGPAGDGSNTAANGQALLNAIDFLGTVVPPPGETNPWLIKVEPGVYDVGASSVEMMEFVDIEGSGQERSVIRGGATSVVLGSDNAERRGDRSNP